ncbi:MAG: hypothetical protein ACYC2E_12775 [Sulfuricella sp.]
MRKEVFIGIFLASISCSAWSVEAMQPSMSSVHKSFEFSLGVVTWAAGKIVKKKVSNINDHSGGRTFAPFQKRKDPNSKRSNKLGPKKD